MNRPIALVSNLLHMPTMVGYNRYSVSLANALSSRAPGPLIWVPLPTGVHPMIRAQLPGSIAPPVGTGFLSGTHTWSRVERRLRPALWHILTDLPVPMMTTRPVIVTCHGLPRWLRHRHMIAGGQLPGGFWDYQDISPSWGARRDMVREWASTWLGLRRATAIVTDSDYGKWELVTKFGIRADKITVVHLAADPVFTSTRTQDEVDAVRAKYSLPSRFALGVASFSRTKNTPGLIRLAAGLAKSGSPPLVLIGPAGAIGSHETAGLQVGKSVFVLQNIPDADLACVYRSAEVFVNLAWEETFGLPIVEAMAAGTAIVGSNRTAVPEVIGSGGLVVDPADSDAVLRAVRGVLVNPDLRADLKVRALRRATDFSWDKAARETTSVYNRILATRAATHSL